MKLTITIINDNITVDGIIKAIEKLGPGLADNQKSWLKNCFESGENDNNRTFNITYDGLTICSICQ